MPKKLIVTLEVPSRSTPEGMLKWLNKILESHNMKALRVQDEESSNRAVFSKDPRTESGWDGGA